MKINLIPILMGLFVVSATFSGLSAEKENRFEHRLEKMKEHLKLTDEQSAKIKGIYEKYGAQRGKLKTEMQAAKQASQKLMSAEKLDRTQIRASLENSAKIRINLRMLSIDQRLEMEQILTPAQKKIWREKMKQRQKKKGDKKQNRRDKKREKRE